MNDQPEFEIGQCPECGNPLHIGDIASTVPRLAFLLSVLTVHIAAVDLIMSHDYNPASEGWEQRKQLLEKLLMREIDEISTFGEAYD